MALKATIFKATLQISDMDRHYYQTHELTIARHPSENDARMMVRLVAFAMNATEQLRFTKGLSTDDEPDLWDIDLAGDIQHWIDLGNPDVKRIRKACGRAKQVSVYCYQAGAARPWWAQFNSELQRFSNLNVTLFPEDFVNALALLAERSMDLQISIQDAELWLTCGDQQLHLIPEIWKSADE